MADSPARFPLSFLLTSLSQCTLIATLHDQFFTLTDWYIKIRQVEATGETVDTKVSLKQLCVTGEGNLAGQGGYVIGRSSKQRIVPGTLVCSPIQLDDGYLSHPIYLIFPTCPSVPDTDANLSKSYRPSSRDLTADLSSARLVESTSKIPSPHMALSCKGRLMGRHTEYPTITFTALTTMTPSCSERTLAPKTFRILLSSSRSFTQILRYSKLETLRIQV